MVSGRPAGLLTKVVNTPRPEDVQATLLALTVESIARTIETNAPKTTEIAVCGGGAHNIYMMKQLEKRLPTSSIKNTDHLGLTADSIEAVAFAWLARQTIKKRPGNDPIVTGAKQEEILGGIYQAY